MNNQQQNVVKTESYHRDTAEIDDTQIEKMEDFLGELTELATKYGYEIWGCGCCDSPRLNSIEHPGRYIVECDGHEFGSLEWKE